MDDSISEVVSLVVDTNIIEKIGKNGSWLLTDTKQLNFFIGPNNSGKSRQIRELFSDSNKWMFELSLLSIDSIAEQILIRLKDRSLSSRLMQLHFVEDSKLKGVLAGKNWKTSDFDGFVSSIHQKSKVRPNYSDSQEETDFYEFISDILLEEERGTNFIEKYNELKYVLWTKIYIPTLRTLRNVSGEGDEDIFLRRTRSDYFDNGGDYSKTVFTGHQLYQDLVEHLLGSHEKRQKVREYERYLSENFFFGNDISLVPMVDKDVVYLKEGDSPDRPIYDLGDGIQSIILLTYKLFMAEEPTMFFIEEPEHYLHPGLQRTLIETFANHKEHMFFMTTHSNHFLDLAQERNDVSIQQVSRKGGETIVAPAKAYGDVLTELGVRASSVLLANCSIWVEGVTDKLYLREYLRKYIEELEDEEQANRLRSYHENLHYIFTEYQGSNITHWNFSENASDDDSQTPAKLLSRNILLIADADIQSKGDRVAALTNDLGDSFHLLEWKEIENYIPFDILIDTAKARWETFNLRTDCHIDRFSNITIDKFQSESSGIGAVLERYVYKPKDSKRDFFKDKSGTIKDKVKFCHTAIELMQSSREWTLSPELTELCEKVWQHIEAHNQVR